MYRHIAYCIHILEYYVMIMIVISFLQSISYFPQPPDPLLVKFSKKETKSRPVNCIGVLCFFLRGLYPIIYVING